MPEAGAAGVVRLAFMQGGSLIASLHKHVRHHARFYGAGLVGALVFAFGEALPPSLRLIVSGDAFFAIYLTSTAVRALGATPDELRRHVSYADEGVMVILFLTLTAVSLCLAALFALLLAPGSPATLPLALAILSVLLGWFTLHTVVAFRYLHLYYTQGSCESPVMPGGSSFPGAGSRTRGTSSTTPSWSA